MNININIMGVSIFLFLLVTLGSAATPLTYESEYSSVVPPARLYKATVLDDINFISKIRVPGIKSVERLEGNGGVGTVKKITFSGDGPTNFSTQKIESIDEDNLAYTFSLIQGENLEEDGLEKITFENKYVAASGGGTTIRSVLKYFPNLEKPEISSYELDVLERKKVVSFTFKIADKYLLANPDAYN